MKSPDGRRRVLLLDIAESDELAILVSRCLQLAGGYEVHVLSGAQDTPLRRSKHARVRHVPLETPDGVLRAVAAYVERRPVDLVVPIHERTIAMAGEVAGKLGRLAPLAPGPDPDLCRRVDDKWGFHQLMSEAGLPVPRAASAAGTRASLLRELGGWGSPLLLKPRLGEDGAGIRSFERTDDLLAAIDDLPPATREGFLVQEYIPGADIDCDLLAFDGRVIAHTVQRNALHPVQAFSSGLGSEFVRDEFVAAVAARFAEVTRWTGVANLNVRIDARTGEPVLIEVNPRYGQTMLGSLAMGTNFPDLHCRLAFGPPPVPAKSRTGFYLDMFTLLTSPRNIVVLLRRDPGFLRYINWRIVLADPRVGVGIAFRALKRTMAWRVARAGQFVRRALGGRGSSA